MKKKLLRYWFLAVISIVSNPLLFGNDSAASTQSLAIRLYENLKCVLNTTIEYISPGDASLFFLPMPPGSISVRVDASSDDAEESLSSGAVTTSSSDLELCVDGSTSQLVGMRFNGMTIPTGATITSAYVEFETDAAWSSACNLTIKGQAADNPGTFTTSTNNLSSRTKTTASVSWSPAAWNTVDEKHQSPDLTTIIQEIVNRSGWASGNSMVVFVEGTGTREAESYDGEAAAAPLLVVNYTTAPTEICNNGLDDDGDGLVDCADSDCSFMTNNEFDNGLTGWELYVQDDNNATKSLDNTSQLSGVNSAYINVSEATGTDWHIQFVQKGKSIVAGKTYNVTFQAKAVANRNISVMLQLDQSPWTNYWYQSVPVTTTGQTFSYDFQVNTTNSGHIGLYFNLGSSTANVWLDKITFSEICTLPENCSNGIDDDGDGLIDNDDPDCQVYLPGGVAGATLWLKANVGAGTTTEGATVSNWQDLSGTGNNATTGLNPGWTNPGLNPPVYRKGTSTLGINFNPSIDFSGDKSLDGLAGLSPKQVFAVFKNPTSGKNVIGFDDADGGGGGAQSGLIYWSTQIHMQARNTTGNNLFGAYLWHSTPASQPLIFDGQHITSTTGSLLLNGGLTTTVANTGTPPAPFTGGYRLNKSSDNQYPANGQIAEVISFNTNLSTTNRQKVTSYLGLKYGITLSHNYLNSAGTTIYNVSAYGNNIAGIGRDDASSLNQKQSKSENTGLQVVIGNGSTIATDNATNTNDFLIDNSALVWGDNAGSVAAWTATGAPIGTQIVARTWKVQETGIVGYVKIQVADNSGTNGLPNEGTNPVSLLVDADGNFAAGATLIPMTLNGTNWEANVNLTNGQYFTFGMGCTISLASSQVNVTPCYGASNGAINLSPSGGIAPYTYTWSDIGSTGNFQNRTGLTAGEYKVAVTDAASCAAVAYFTITQPTAINLSATVVNAVPAGSSNGAIDLTVTNGTSPYAYSWSASSGGVVPSGQTSGQDLTGLVAGTYKVTVTDAGSCTATATYSVQNSVTKQLYLSDPSQALDRVDPVATADGTTATTSVISGVGGGTPTTVTLDVLADSDVDQAAVYTNWGNCTVLVLNGSSSALDHPLLKFDLSGIPADAIISSATMTLVRIGGGATGSSGSSSTSVNVSAHQVTNAWTEGTGSCSGVSGVANWAQRQTGTNWTTAGGDYNPTAEATTSVAGSGSYSWDIPNMVQNWINTPANNQGVLLKMVTEPTAFYKQFASRENSTVANRPKLTITYTLPNNSSSTFTQNPVLCSPLQMPAGGTVAVKTYLSNIAGATSSISTASTSNGYSASVASGGTLSFSHTPGTGSNRLLLVAIAVGNTGVSDETAPGTVTGVTFGGTPMTLVNTVYSGYAVRSYIYRLLNPTASPTANVVISIGTKTSGVTASATTFNGVNQTSPLGAPVSFVANSSDYFVTGNISSATGELVYSTAAVDEYTGVQQGISTAAGQTELWNNSGFNYVSGASSTKPGASSVSLKYDMLDYEDGSMAAVSIKPAPALSTMPVNPNISAVLKYGSTTIATLSNPTYNSGTGLLTWSQTLGSAVPIPAGEAISLVITNNESGISFKIDYDSQTKPSRIELPVSTYIDISSYSVYDAPYPGGNIISNAVGGTYVYPRAVVTDPFGFSDINGMNITITPTGNTVAATSVATSGCTRTYQYAWVTPFSAGTFTLPATAKEGYENTVTDIQPLSFDLCTPTIGTPVFALGATSSRCQGAGSATYSATATSTTGITYSLDAASLAAGNTISSVTGLVTYTAGWGGNTTITATASGCGGPKMATHIVTISPTVTTPIFVLGANSSRCQGTGTVTYTASATNATGITYSLDATSLSAGNTINASTGVVNFTSGWSGTSIITASAAGCSGPKTATHTVTHTLTVTTPVFALGATSTRCQAGGSVTYSASASNTTGITYSLDATSIAAGNVINASTGVVSYAAGWNGTSIITATANGCNGPKTATHTVTNTPNGTITFALGAASTRAAGNGNVTYSATANNGGNVSYSLDATSLAAGLTINSNTGMVNYTAGWTGTSTITASVAGCGGTQTATHIASTGNVYKQLYLSDPSQALDRVHPGLVSPVDNTTASTSYLCQGAGARGSFTIPTDISSQYGGNDSQTPDVAVYESVGTETLHTVFLGKGSSDSKNNIYYSSKTGTGAWSSPVRISNDGFNQDAQVYPSIAVDANGKAYVVYAHKNGASDSKINIYYVTNTSGSWSSPMRISNDGFNQDAATPEIALDGNGKAYVVYQHKSGIDAKKNIYYVTNASGSWSSPVRISDDGYNQDVKDNPAIALDASNKAHVVFTHKSGSDSKYNIYYVTNASGSWSSSARISNDAFNNDALSNPSITLDENGKPHVVYAHKNSSGDSKLNIYYVNKTSGSWSSPVDLSNDKNGEDSENPDLVISSCTGIVRVVFSNKNQNIYYTENSGSGNSWTTPLDLNPTSPTKSDSGDNPSVAMSNSMVHVIFEDKHASLGDKLDVWHVSAPLTPATSVATTTFTQTPAMCSPLIIKAGLPITVTNYVSIVSGFMPASPSVTAVLKYGATNIISMTNPTYNSGTGLLTWTGTLLGDVTVPAGEAIALEIKSAQSNVSFKIDYDSQSKPSKIDLPVSTFIDISSYAIYSAAYPGGSIITSTVAGTTVYPRVVVTDPFGFSDITGLNLTITPSGSTVAATSVATSGCTRTYEYAWNTAALGGNYSLTATAKEGYENAVSDLQALSFDICSPTIGAPVFSLGASSTRCRGAGTTTYTATSTNSTGMTYSLDAASLAEGNTINTATGAVTYLAGWSGTSVITASASGCGGPKTSTHTVTITPFVEAPVFSLGAVTTRCQGAGTVTYAASATNSTGITYSLDGASISGGNTINTSTGAVTYAAGWSGTTIVTASAAGCSGPAISTHTVTITSGVGTPVFALGASSGRCGISGTYTATATNATSISYSLDATSLAAGNSINPSTGAVTFTSSWLGASTITATAIGCNGSATATHTVSISPDCPPVAVDDAANGAGGAPIPINVLSNDTDVNNNINPSSVSIVTTPVNGSAVLSGGQVVYLPNGTFEGFDLFTYRVCDLTSPTPLCDTATVVVTIDPTTADACSEAVRRQVYYLPFPEQEVRTALIASTVSWALPIPTNNIRTVISIKIPYPGMTLVYDHWEDGFETDPDNPTQSTTQVWGDGNPYNGIAPGYSDDILPSGAAIVLDNTMPAAPRVASNIFYDGKDKIVSSGAITVAQVSGEPSIIGKQCMKANVTPTSNYGESFTIPVGQDFNSQDFAYTALFIRASENNTTINIDKDNNGTFETTSTLNEGQSYFLNGGVLSGASVTSSAPIGVDIHYGGIDGYSSREVPCYPSTWYSDTYYTPVPTTQSPDTAVVMLYNSLNRAIDINWNYGTSGSGTISLPAKTVKRFPLSLSSSNAYKFNNPTGESFTAIEIVDSYTPTTGANSGSTYDWAFNLISEDRLTSFAAIAWAPGGTDATVNGNPIWVTPAANTTIYVKYDGDVLNGGSISPCGMHYDVSYALNTLSYKKLLDSDNDQSGLAVYTCDGTKIAAVYGEDPSLSEGGFPYWDVGSTIQPFCGEKLILANDDRVYTLVDQPVTIPVLKNDAGFLAVIDPATLATLGYLQPKNGTVSVNSNGTLLYTPNPGFVGIDTLEYGICSTPGSPPNVVCDRAYVYVEINACPSPAQRNIISGQIFLDKNKDGVNNDGGTGFTPGKVYLYVDGNCNSTINAGELVDSVNVDSSGMYQFLMYPEKVVADNFDGTGGTNTCASGSDGTAAWASNWVDAGDVSTGFCVSPVQSAANTDVEIVQDGAFGYALRLDDLNKSATRTLNLSGATYAFLSFSYRKATNSLTYGEDVRVQVSTNGSTFTTIFTISGNSTTDASYVKIYNQNISAYAGATTYIRFLTNGSVDEGDYVFIDDVSIRYLKYPQCYITKIDPALIPADYYLTTAGQHAMTAVNSGICLTSYDFGVTKNSTAISGTLYNDPNGLSDGLVNGTPIGSPSGATVYAYLISASGEVRFKTTVNSSNGTFSITQADVNSTFTLMLSTANLTLYSTAPASASLPAGWASAGEAYGTNNGTGTGNEAGTPNSIITVITGASAVTGVKIGIQKVNAGPDQVACVNGTATLAATTTPGIWTAQSVNPGTATITSPTSPTSAITDFTDPGVYYFLWTNNGVSDTAAVMVDSLPVANAGDDQTICTGASATLTASGGVSYAWDNGLGAGASKTVTPASTTTYTATVTNVEGCTATGQVTVAIGPCPEVCNNGIDDDWDGLTDCADPDCEAPVITNVSLISPSNCPFLDNGQLTITATGPYLEYSIDGGVSFQSSNVFAGLSAGNYYIRIRNSTSGCYEDYAGNPVVISETTCPEICGNGIDDDGDGFIDCEDSDCEPVPYAGSDVNICIGSSHLIAASATGGISPYTYNWDNGLGAGQSHSVSPATTTIYFVTITSASGCSSVDSVTVAVAFCPEDCTDGIDNDGDGLVDCDDPDCQATGQPQPVWDSYNVCPGTAFQEQVIFNDNNLQNAAFSIAEQPNTGNVSMGSANGVFTYSPSSSACTNDRFVYQVCNQMTGCCDTASVFLILRDTIKPSLVNVPADITISCEAAVPTPPFVYGLDSCPGIYISYEEISTKVNGGSCQNYTITRTWEATDLCGNTQSSSQVITVEDATPPELFRVYTLANGKKVAAGISQRNTNIWKFVKFPVNFNVTPVVFSQVISENETDAVTTRQRNISLEGFEVRLQEQESSNGQHIAEQVAWVAIEPGALSDLSKMQTGLITNVNNTLKTLTFSQPFASSPAFIASMQTTKDSNPACIRISNLGTTSVNLFTEEEQSADAEVTHNNEDVGYLGIKPGMMYDTDNTYVAEAGVVTLSSAWTTVSLGRKYNKPVVIFGGLPADGTPATIRVKDVTSNSFKVRIQNWSYLAATHGNQPVSYLVVEGSVPATTGYFCDPNAVQMIPGVNLFATDNCDNQVAFVDDETYTDSENGLLVVRSWTGLDDCGNYLQVFKTDTCSVAMVKLKTFLAGALLNNGSTGLMRDDLRAKGYLPLTEPFTNMSGFQHKGMGGGESMTPEMLQQTGPDAIVDWVFVEIRDSTAAGPVLATKSALLQRDGDVVAVDGRSYLLFRELIEGNYKVSIRHRNHLGMMSGSNVYLSSAAPLIDFKNVDFAINGIQDGGKLMSNGSRAMWPGDMNGDRKVVFQGPSNDIFHLFSHVLSDTGNMDFLANFISTGYHRADLNMDGNVIYQGPNNDKALLLYQTVLVHPGNIGNLANFIVIEKMP